VAITIPFFSLCLFFPHHPHNVPILACFPPLPLSPPRDSKVSHDRVRPPKNERAPPFSTGGSQRRRREASKNGFLHNYGCQRPTGVGTSNKGCSKNQKSPQNKKPFFSQTASTQKCVFNFFGIGERNHLFWQQCVHGWQGEKSLGNSSPILKEG
jgi:hypothetical protein